jgi:ribosomal peptide maturation radical SAM protein 1
LDYTFFYETKANLSNEQLKQLARGGVRRLQPGIESLNSNVLKLMRKGTTGINNVRVLKWGRYYNIRMYWNVLLGFPGERAEDYDQQITTMRLIPHLQPPEGAAPIWLERFSPNYTRQAELGITNVRPERAYAYVYPEIVDLYRAAYFFTYESMSALPTSSWEQVVEYVKFWQEQWTKGNPPFLVYQRGAGRLTITDGRQPGAPRISSFDELSALIYEFCTPTARGMGQIAEYLRAGLSLDVDQAMVRSSLDEFQRLGLVLEEDNRYLGLAIPINPNW